MMDNFKCFQNNEPIPCEELCDNDLKIYFKTKFTAWNG